MSKHRAIPEGYMTVGEVAKKMNTTVRTLQYYDKEGILHPSAESEGGRRLYTDQDIVSLYQILAMKYLGFSLDDIKIRLPSFKTPVEVAEALSMQAESVRKQIAALSEVLDNIEKLQAETLQMQHVDFKKYADIIVSLQRKNEYYHYLKYFDEKTMEYVQARFGDDRESPMRMANTMNRLFDEATSLLQKGVSPESDRGLAFAKEFWAFITEFTGGDVSQLPQLMEMGKMVKDEAFQKRQALAIPFIESALEAYFKKLGHDPLEEITV